jgi:hypothetical protein
LIGIVLFLPTCSFGRIGAGITLLGAASSAKSTSRIFAPRFDLFG